MFNGTDVFIINSCIKGVSLENIAKTLGFNMQELDFQLHKLKSMGFNIYPGMKATKIKGLDLKVYELLISGLSIKDIAEFLGEREHTISYSKQKILQLLSNKDELPKGLDIEKSNKKIAEYIKQGKKTKDIAECMGIRYNALCMRIKKMEENNIVLPRKQRLDEIDMSIIDCAEHNLTVTEIAEYLNMSTSGVYARIKKMKTNNVEISICSHKHFKMDEIDKKIVECRLNKKNIKEISEIVGLCPSAVSLRIQKMRKNGVSIVHGNVFRGTRLKKVNEVNLKKAINNFVKSKKPTPEQLDAIVEYAAEVYKVDADSIKKVAKYIDDDMEI